MKSKILAVVILIFVAFGSYFLYGNYFANMNNKNIMGKYNEVSYGNSSGNLSNGGYVTRYNDYLYGDLNPSGQGLFRSNLKLKNFLRLTDDQALFVNTDGQWVYYVNYSDNMHLYKVSVNGGEKIKLSSDKVDGLNLVNGTLYYIDISQKRTMHSMTTEGKDNKLIGPDSNCMNLIIKNDWAFYSVKNIIYRINVDGENKIKLAVIRTDPYGVMDFWKGNFDVDGNLVYYPGLDGNLYTISVDGKNNTILVSGNIESTNIYNGYLYYFSETSKTIYRIKLGTKPKPEYIFGGADYYSIIIVNNDGVMFKDKSVINGGIYMVEKKL